MQYPFLPRSTRNLEPGHFWRIKLPDDQSSAGVVVGLIHKNGERHTRLFLAGLLDWCGTGLPGIEELQGTKVLVTGVTHIKAVGHQGEAILGKLLPKWRLHESLELEQHILLGGHVWGYEFIGKKAEAVFCDSFRERPKSAA